MSQEFHEHWLSAYLDDELSSDERALVERRLAEDAEARQLLEDLKRVRGLVATLPGWEGKEFNFDINRLASSGIDDEDVADQSAYWATNDPDLRVVATPAKQKSSAMTPAAWRGILSLAAGVLLLILSVPLFWQQMKSQVALDSSPKSRASVGSQTDDLLADRASGAGNTEGSEQLTAHSYGTDPQSKPAAAMPPAPTAAADATAEVALVEKFSRSSVQTPPPPAPSRAMPPSPSISSSGLGGGGGLPGSLGQPADPTAVPKSTELRLESAFAEGTPTKPPADPSAKELLDLQLGNSLAARQMDAVAQKSDKTFANQLLFAKSESWTEDDVADALPQLRSIVPGSRALIETNVGLGEQTNSPVPDGASTQRREFKKNQESASAADKELEAMTRSEPGINDWLITELPVATDLDNWFAKIQTTQSLTSIQVTNAVVNQIQSQPTKPTESEVQDVAATATGALSKTLQFDSPAPTANEPSQQKTPSKKESVTGHIVLFVTEKEAKQILSTIFGRASSNYWRVVPAGANNSDQSTSDSKVILILNQSP